MTKTQQYVLDVLFIDQRPMTMADLYASTKSGNGYAMTNKRIHTAVDELVACGAVVTAVKDQQTVYSLGEPNVHPMPCTYQALLFRLKEPTCTVECLSSTNVWEVIEEVRYNYRPPVTPGTIFDARRVAQRHHEVRYWKGLRVRTAAVSGHWFQPIRARFRM